MSNSFLVTVGGTFVPQPLYQSECRRLVRQQEKKNKPPAFNMAEVENLDEQRAGSLWQPWGGLAVGVRRGSQSRRSCMKFGGSAKSLVTCHSGPLQVERGPPRIRGGSRWPSLTCRTAWPRPTFSHTHTHTLGQAFPQGWGSGGAQRPGCWHKFLSSFAQMKAERWEEGWEVREDRGVHSNAGEINFSAAEILVTVF